VVRLACAVPECSFGVHAVKDVGRKSMRLLEGVRHHTCGAATAATTKKRHRMGPEPGLEEVGDAAAAECRVMQVC